MPSIAVVGANWGNEGKSHIVAFLTNNAPASIRFQGGNKLAKQHQPTPLS